MTMNSSNGICSLYLCPEQHDFTVKDDSALILLLQDIGFISQKINARDTGLRYFTGERFLNYVSYMGCAPAIQFEASENKPDFCFVDVHHYDTAKLIHSTTQNNVMASSVIRSPHCPACNKSITDWQNQLTKTTIFCDACNTISDIETISWRKMAGYARLFIEITDIFPKEAIPQPNLLDKLADAFNTEWIYFYSCR